MAEIVHITFEKLTGLKGSIEGEFVITNTKQLQGVYVFRSWTPSNILLTQGNDILLLHFLPHLSLKECKNYREHFRSGTNLLIKEWRSYDAGRGAEHISQSPN
jgi:hypothetical protein